MSESNKPIDGVLFANCPYEGCKRLCVMSIEPTTRRVITVCLEHTIDSALRSPRTIPLTRKETTSECSA